MVDINLVVGILVTMVFSAFFSGMESVTMDIQQGYLAGAV